MHMHMHIHMLQMHMQRQWKSFSGDERARPPGQEKTVAVRPLGAFSVPFAKEVAEGCRVSSQRA